MTIAPPAHTQILVEVEEVVVPIKDGGKTKENRQGENFGGSAVEGGNEDKMQKGTIIIIVTKENPDLFGTGFTLKIMVTMLEVSFSNLIKMIKSLVFCSNCYSHNNKETTQTMWPLATHGLPMVRRRRGCPSHFANMRVKWMQKKTLRMRSNYELVKANVRLKSNTMLIRRHKFQFPIEANSRLKGNKCVPF
jgi:hypothetical protein